MNPEGFRVVSLHANDSAALAITTEIVADHGRQGPLVFTLIKRDGIWLLDDIDVETAATAKDELDRFLERYPDAVEIPVRRLAWTFHIHCRPPSPRPRPGSAAKRSYVVCARIR